MKLSKKILAITCAVLMMATALSTNLCMVSAAEQGYTEADWIKGGEGNVTVNSDGTLNIAQFSNAVLNAPIDLTASDLDVSVKMALPFANANQMVSVILTKNTADLGTDSANTIVHRFAKDGDKYGLNHSWINGSAYGAFAGGYIPFENGQVTIRIKNDNGTVRLYMDDTCIIYLADHAENYSNAVKAMGTAYLGISVSSGDGPITATILEVNGKTPVTVATEPETPVEPEVPEENDDYTEADWVKGGEGNVTVNSDGTLNIAQFSNAVLNAPINLTADNLDVSVKMAIPFANTSQMVSVILTKDPADISQDSTNTIVHRFAKDGDKYALNHSWINGSAYGSFAGGYIPFENGQITVRVKNDNGTVRLYIDNELVIYLADHAENYSNAVKAMGTAYLGISVTSFDGPITATILEVNGKTPVTVATEPEPPVEPEVPEENNDYTEADWVKGGEGNVTVNSDGTLNIAQFSNAVLNAPINLTDPNLDVSVKMAIPFANASQLVSVILTKDPADISQDSANTIVHRFAKDGDKYGLNHSWINGSAYGAFAGGYIPFENGQITVRVKNDNGTVRLYIDNELVIYLADHAENYSNAVKAMGTAYLGISVNSFDGPITATILEVNGKTPVTLPACEHEYAYPCDAHCAKCGELTNPDAAHSVKHVEAKEPTCTAEGNIEYWTCEYCGAAWADEACTQVTNLMSVKLGASCKYGAVYTAAKDATCDEPGNTEYWYCANCDVYYADADCTVITNAKNVILPVAHNVIHVEAKEPTCTELGNIEYWFCEDCGSAWLDELCRQNTNLMAVKLGASCKYGAVYTAAKDATCYEEGNVEYWYCANCDVYYADADCTVITNAKNVILPVAHNVKHVEAKDPTCTELGNIEYWYCEDCGSAWLDELCHLNTNLKAVVLPMADHIYDNDYDEACNVCGGIRTVEMPITCAGTSISEDVSGLAALFTINVDGLAIKEGTKTVADYSNATVDGYKLIDMGVIASNNVDELTIPAKYLFTLDAENGTATYAARIINIPADKYDVEITFRSYFVIEIDGVETTVYGDTVTASYNAVLNG